MKRKEAILNHVIRAVIGEHWLTNVTHETLDKYTVHMIEIAFDACLDSGSLAAFPAKDCAAVYQTLTGKLWDAFIAERDEILNRDLAQNRAILAEGQVTQ